MQPTSLSMVLLLVTLLVCAVPLASAGKPAAGDGCEAWTPPAKPAEGECGSPDTKLGCCFANTQCFAQTDCASYLKHCPFSNDGKKSDRLACMPDDSKFVEGSCSAEEKGAKDIPITGPKVICFASDKLTCAIYKNATHTHITAKCKATPASSGAAPRSWTTWAITAAAGLLGPWVAMLGMGVL